MSDLTSLGYPQGYHLGFSAILWWIAIFVFATLGVKLYLNARKSDLINVKEILRAKSFMYICMSIQSSFIQVGMFFPDNFLEFYFFGLFLGAFSFTLYINYWEKNLTSIKRIPTLSAVAAWILTLIGLITFILFPGLIEFLLDFLIFTILSLVAIAIVLYVYLIYIFSKNVKGVSTTIGRIWMGGMILFLVAFSFEHPPGVKIFPTFLVFYIAPILIMITFIMAFYGINKLFTQISSYYAQTQKCAVHRGVIEKGDTMYLCPSCGIVYCDKCFNQVIKTDGCWNCRKGADLEIEKEWKIEQVLEVKKGAKTNYKKLK